MPITMLVQRLAFGVRGRTLASLASRFRRRVAVRALLLVVPLCLAAEALLMRMTPLTASDRSPAVHVVIGSTALVVLFHLTLDPSFVVDLLLFGATTALVTWRTGGLEVAVVMHAVGNMGMELPRLLGYEGRDDTALGLVVGYVPTLVTLAAAEPPAQRPL